MCSLEAHVLGNTRGDVLGLLFAFRNLIAFRVCASTVHALAAAPCTYADAEARVTRALSRTYVRRYSHNHTHVRIYFRKYVRTYVGQLSTPPPPPGLSDDELRRHGLPPREQWDDGGNIAKRPSWAHPGRPPTQYMSHEMHAADYDPKLLPMIFNAGLNRHVQKEAGVEKSRT